MGTLRLAKTETIYRENGVVATRSAAGFLIFLPRAVSANHQLCLVAALWEVWIAGRNDVCGIELNWTIDVSEFDDLPFPLIAVISSIDADLGQAGRTLRVVGPPARTPLAETRLRRSRTVPDGDLT